MSKSKSYSKPTGTCFRCGRPGHYSNECYARTTKRGEYLDSEDD